MSGEQPMVFASTVEGLKRALGDKLDEKAHRQFDALGLSLRGKLQPTYPRDIWLKVSLYAGEVLSPGLAPEAQRVALGRRFVRGYGDTIVGSALVAAMRVLGPKRALARLERSFRTGNNYSRAEFRELPDALEIDILGAPYPEWYEGILLESLVVTSAKDIDVKAIRYEPPTITTYRVKFRT